MLLSMNQEGIMKNLISIAVLGLSLAATAGDYYHYKDITSKSARQFPKEQSEKELKREIAETQEKIQMQEERLEQDREHVKELEDKLDDVRKK